MKGMPEIRAALEDARMGKTPGRGAVAAFVGAGGKTTAIFALARLAADEGLSVAVTTTTRIYDPRDEGCRPFDGVVLDPLLGKAVASGPCVPDAATPRCGRILVLAAGRDDGQGKLIGIDPSRCSELADAIDLVLVEADGSRGLPIKAPADHEPVLPGGPDIIFGLIGLDCLGKPATAAVVHRLDRFLAVTGAAAGSPIAPVHLGLLAAHPEGLFKATPASCLRLAVLNKADSVAPGLAALALEAVASSAAPCRAVLASLVA